jgi:hypothetical protein
VLASSDLVKKMNGSDDGSNLQLAASMFAQQINILHSIYFIIIIIIIGCGGVRDTASVQGELPPRPPVLRRKWS